MTGCSAGVLCGFGGEASEALVGQAEGVILCAFVGQHVLSFWAACSRHFGTMRR
jgi:hypothetical protein